MHFKLRRRGIAPLIATVLIIGFTVALGAIVFVWGSSYSGSLQSRAETQKQETMECASDTSFMIKAASFSQGQITLLLNNDGANDISDFSIRLIGEWGVNVTTHAGTPKNTVKAYTINHNGLDTGKISKIGVIPAIMVGNKEIYCSNIEMTDGLSEQESSMLFVPTLPVCGNTICEGGEDCNSCPGDCGACSPCDNDAVCDYASGENNANCAADCNCGDAYCYAADGEDCSTCVNDCGCSLLNKCDAGACISSCPDGVCNATYGEDEISCPGDCFVPVCDNDAICDYALGENKTNCAADCKCGDGYCYALDGETQSTCCADCSCPSLQKCSAGTCVNTCGTGGCEAGYGETQSTCCADCGCPSLQKCSAGTCVNTCGTGGCEAGYGETVSTCCTDCGCSGEAYSCIANFCVMQYFVSQCNAPCFWCNTASPQFSDTCDNGAIANCGIHNTNGWFSVQDIRLNGTFRPSGAITVNVTYYNSYSSVPMSLYVTGWQDGIIKDRFGCFQIPTTGTGYKNLLFGTSKSPGEMWGPAASSKISSGAHSGLYHIRATLSFNVDCPTTLAGNGYLESDGDYCEESASGENDGMDIILI